MGEDEGGSPALTIAGLEPSRDLGCDLNGVGGGEGLVGVTA